MGNFNSGKPSKPVFVYDLDLNLQAIYPSTAQCARTMHLSQGNISNCCNGSLDTYKNLIFSFSPLDKQIDRDIVLYLGIEKHDKRIEQVNKAVHKYYNKDVEAGRARARKYYENKKAKKNGERNT